MTIIGLVAAGLGVSIRRHPLNVYRMSGMRWVPTAKRTPLSEMAGMVKHHEQVMPYSSFA